MRAALARACLAGMAALAAVAPAHAERAVVAVATNFRLPAEALVSAFAATEQGAQHRIDLVAGSTGKLYGQIAQGAPYDAFLAADTARPKRLVAEGSALAESYAVYAIGRLVFVGGDEQMLRQHGFERLAIANPKLAPYGRAAQQTLARLGLTDRAEAGLVIGENVGQAWAMMQLGGADAGLVAASLLQASADRPDHWMVPANLHDPIEQAMVLLPRAEGNAAARAFVRFLRSAPGRALIQRQGYETHASSTP